MARNSLLKWFLRPVALADCLFSFPSSRKAGVSPTRDTIPYPQMSSQRCASSAANDQVDLPTTWSDVVPDPAAHARASHLLPPHNTSTSHKGSDGRIAIFGGSEKYCGAPYYAATAALRCGVDLATVFCAAEASVPIKCYGPELMVQGAYSIELLDALWKEMEGIVNELEQCRHTGQGAENEAEPRQPVNTLERSEEEQRLLGQRSELKKENAHQMELLKGKLAKIKSLEEELQIVKVRHEDLVDSIVSTITQVFPTLHALCIGPGLGRHPLVFRVAEKVMHKAVESRLMLVLDADALFMLSLDEYKSLLGVLMLYDRCVMTPNLMEMKRLSDALLTGEVYRNIIVQKGAVDKIINERCTMQDEEEGGLKRCGGIGDVLSGSVTAFMAWNAILVDKDDRHDEAIIDEVMKQRVFACWTATILVKKATKLAYEKKRRSMSALDVLGEIGYVVSTMEEGLKLECCN